MTRFFTHSFNPPGYITAKLSDTIAERIAKDVAEIENNNFEGYANGDSVLAGHLTHQLDFPQGREYLNEIVLVSAAEYAMRFRFPNYSTECVPVLKDLWINFQKKHDFNPVHEHSGDLSFVIWHRIPYDLDNELDVYKEGLDSAKTSTFQFFYNDTLGKLCNKTLHISKEWENVICMFPAQLNHCVYPFYTSDDYRISIAGNVSFIQQA
jgi:hypothetical protein